MYDCAIIGGGIVGLAAAMTLSQREPELRVLVLEKEADFALHQSGRNSGVIHSGIYYKPGSAKARFAREGNRSMVEFCQRHGIPHEVCGKIIVATTREELPLLENLRQRGLQNGLEVQKLSPEQVKEIEPHARCLAAIRVPSTGITDFRQVCAEYVRLLQMNGGVLKTGAKVESIRTANGSYILETKQGNFEAGFLINCAGLHSDRIARLGGIDPGARILPFRGEYYELVPEKRRLVKTLIYPVPNPAFPFLGVHLTRMIDGSVHAGPNAVLALKREGYHKTSFELRDILETMAYPGFWKLARRHFRDGLEELWRSLSKRAFARSLQRLVPEIEPADLIAAEAGVRAQAVMASGMLVDDFLIIQGPNSMHVCNAPSPAATASLPIGKAIVNQIPKIQSRATVGN